MIQDRWLEDAFGPELKEFNPQWWPEESVLLQRVPEKPKPSILDCNCGECFPTEEE